MANKSAALRFRIELEFKNIGLWGVEKTGLSGEKRLGRRKDEKKQQIEPTYEDETWNSTAEVKCEILSWKIAFSPGGSYLQLLYIASHSKKASDWL